MSLTSVQAKIKSAMLDHRISEAEAQGIVKEAEKNGVTLREGKAVADLFESHRAPPPPGTFQTMAIPEYPGDVIFEGGSRGVLQTFLDKHLIPVGESKDALKKKIQTVTSSIDWSKPMEKAPNVSRLFPVQISAPLDLARDLPDEKAFVDLKSGKFYVRTEGGFSADPAAKFYGPFQLPPAAEPRTDGVSDAKLAAMRKALNDALAGLQFHPGSVATNHMGVRLQQVPLFSERHPDGFHYTAYLPLGALTPTAPRKNPELVNEMYIERTGGFGGLTESAGPIAIGATASAE